MGFSRPKTMLIALLSISAFLLLHTSSGNQGLRVTDEAKDAVRLVKEASKGLPYAVFKFTSDIMNVVIDRDERFYKKELKYDELIKLLPENEPRFVSFKFPHFNEFHKKEITPVLISWLPEETAFRLKMLVANSFDLLHTQLGGHGQNIIEGNDLDDLSQEEVCKKIHCLVLPEDEQDDLSGNVVDINKLVPPTDN